MNKLAFKDARSDDEAALFQLFTAVRTEELGMQRWDPHVRLWSQIAGVWLFNDYAFIAVTPRAQMTTPAPGSTLRASSVSFQWTRGTGVTKYWLSLGTTVGGADLFDHDEGTSLSTVVMVLPSSGSP